MKFDAIIGNPPYQKAKNMREGGKAGTTGGDLWSKFIPKAINLTKEHGYIALIHPPMWRKPEHLLYPIMASKNLCYLEMHSEKDGRQTFNASTKYDWYILQNTTYNGNTTITNEMGGKHVFDLRDYRWLPCFGFDVISKILAQGKDKTCEVLYSRSEYGTDKAWMSDKENGEFKHPCVYSMTKDGFGCWYSSIKKDFAFGVPKVILGWGRYLYPLIDMEGKYGLTQNTFAIKVDSKKEAENIKRAIESDKFGKVLKATKWGAFQTEWRMFKYFRKDFWKEFIA